MIFLGGEWWRGGWGVGQQTFPQNCRKQESFGPSHESSLLTLSDTIVHTLFSLNSDKCSDTANTITFAGGMSWVQVELLVLIQYCSTFVKGIIAVCFDLTERQVSWPGKWTSHLYFGTRHGWLLMVTRVAMLYPQPALLIKNSGYIPFKIGLDASMWLNVYLYWMAIFLWLIFTGTAWSPQILVLKEHFVSLNVYRPKHNIT